MVFVGVLVAAGVLDRPNVRRLTLALITALIMVSLVPLTGWSGQISLAQITFVGIGAWAAFEFSTSGGELFGLELFTPGNPVLLLVGALVAIPFGVLMALPALRLRGLYLALATMAFARMAEFVLFDQPEVFGGQGRRIADLTVFGHDLSGPFTLLGDLVPAGRRPAAPDARSSSASSGWSIVALRRGRVRPPARRDARQPGRVRDARREPVRARSSRCS